MRKIIISFCILLAALSLKAQPVSGIRIDGGDTPARLARENVYGKENGCIMTAFTLTETK